MQAMKRKICLREKTDKGVTGTLFFPLADKLVVLSTATRTAYGERGVLLGAPLAARPSLVPLLYRDWADVSARVCTPYPALAEAFEATDPNNLVLEGEEADIKHFHRTLRYLISDGGGVDREVVSSDKVYGDAIKALEAAPASQDLLLLNALHKRFHLPDRRTLDALLPRFLTASLYPSELPSNIDGPTSLHFLAEFESAARALLGAEDTVAGSAGLSFQGVYNILLRALPSAWVISQTLRRERYEPDGAAAPRSSATLYADIARVRAYIVDNIVPTAPAATDVNTAFGLQARPSPFLPRSGGSSSSSKPCPCLVHGPAFHSAHKTDKCRLYIAFGAPSSGWCARCRTTGHFTVACKTSKSLDFSYPAPGTTASAGAATGTFHMGQLGLYSKHEFTFPALTEGLPRETLLLDCGATITITNDPADLVSTVSGTPNAQLQLGDGHFATATVMGTCRYFVVVGDRRVELPEVPAMLVPGAPVKLLSEPCLSALGVQSVLHPDQPYLTLVSGPTSRVDVPLRRLLPSRLIHVPVMSPSQVELHLANTGLFSWSHAHRILGHRSHASVRKTVEALGLKLTGDPPVDCYECALAKIKRTPVHGSGLTASQGATAVGDYVHIDVSGPYPAAGRGFRGARYALVAKDEFSGYVNFVIFTDKAAIPVALQELVVRTRTAAGGISRIFTAGHTTIRTDNDGVLTSLALKTLLAQQGLRQDNPPPNTPDLNGSIERTIGDLQQLTRTLLLEWGEDRTSLWPLAFMRARDLLNWTVAAPATESPVVRVGNEQPRLELMRPLGSSVIELAIPSPTNNKFAPRGREAMYVTLHPATGAAITYDPTTGRMHVAYHAKVSNRKYGSRASGDWAGWEEINIDAATAERHPSVVPNDAPKPSTVPSSATPSTATGQPPPSPTPPPATPATAEVRPPHTVPPVQLGTPDDVTAPLASTPSGYPRSPATSDNPPRSSTHPAPLPPQSPATPGTPMRPRTRPEPPPTPAPAPVITSSRPDTPSPPPALSRAVRPFRGVNIHLNKRFWVNSVIDDNGSIGPEVLDSEFAAGITVAIREARAEALQSEFYTLNEVRKAFVRVDRSDVPSGAPILRLLVVYTTKADGTLKARLVVDGSQQTRTTDQASPVPHGDVTRLFFSIVASCGFYLISFDFKAAFPQAPYSGDPVYVYAPAIAGLPPGSVYRLNKVLYGLRQAPLLWYKHIKGWLLEQGFEECPVSPGLFIRRNASTGEIDLLLDLFVDDGALAGPDRATMDAFLSVLMARYDIGRVCDPVTTFIGFEVDYDQTRRCLRLTASESIKELAERARLPDAEPRVVPLTPGQQHFQIGDTSQVDQDLYLSLTGSLSWIANTVRLDVALVASDLASFNGAAGPDQWNALLHAIRYLKGTPDVGVTFTGSADRSLSSVSLSAFADAAFAPNPALKLSRSRTGLLIKCAGGPVYWSSHFQSNVALNSTDAEFRAGSEGARALQTLRHVLAWIQFGSGPGVLSSSVLSVPPAVKLPPTELHIDNRAVVIMGSGDCVPRSIRHIEVHDHYLRLAVQNGSVAIQQVSSSHQLADILCKPHHGPIFEQLRAQAMGDAG